MANRTAAEVQQKKTSLTHIAGVTDSLHYENETTVDTKIIMKKYLYLLAAVFPALLGSCKEIEQQMDETTCFYSPVCSLPMMFSEPEEPTSAQLEYVKNYFKEAETQLMNRNFDPETGWQKNIDIESFAKAFIVNENDINEFHREILN